MKLIIPAVLSGALLLTAHPADAQNLPGYQGDYDTAAAQYRAYALEGFQVTLTGWTEAVLAGDLDQAMEYYTEDTFVYLEGAASGKGMVRPLLRNWLATVEHFRTGLSDFDASGSISYSSLHIVVNAVDPEDDGDGTMVFVLKRQGRNWRIRSQTLVMN